jgi:hypothetical protein
MSYDISFKVKAQGADYWFEVGDCDANITWNARQIITESTGLAWENEASNGLCKDVVPQIRKGLLKLLEHPEQYKQYESPNGYGTVEGTVFFFKRIIRRWEQYEEENPKLAEVAEFWIE